MKKIPSSQLSWVQYKGGTREKAKHKDQFNWIHYVPLHNEDHKLFTEINMHIVSSRFIFLKIIWKIIWNYCYYAKMSRLYVRWSGWSLLMSHMCAHCLSLVGQICSKLTPNTQKGRVSHDHRPNGELGQKSNKPLLSWRIALVHKQATSKIESICSTQIWWPLMCTLYHYSKDLYLNNS